MERSPLLAGRRKSTLPAFLAAAAGCFALCALAFLSHNTRTELATTVTQNCDGSMDITTTSILPCAAGGFPFASPTVYTSYAPALPAVPQMPAYMPQAVAPMAPNVYQYPTVWSGDHVISAGQPEWAAEDAAQHALNLANWRIKLLQAKKVQARLANEVMNIGGVSSRGFSGRVSRKASKKSKKTKKSKKSKGSKKKGLEESQLVGIEKNVLALASETRRAIGALAGEVDKEKQHGVSTSVMNRKLGGILRQMDNIQSNIADDDSDDAEDDNSENDDSNDSNDNDNDNEDSNDNNDADE